MFTVAGPYPVIRAGLWARGWVERHLPSSEQKAAQCPNYEMDLGDESGISAGERLNTNVVYKNILSYCEKWK